MTKRDTQRSRVYAWEKRVAEIERRDFFMPEWETLDEVVAWATPIWRSERGRYGRARVPVPSFQRPTWGQGRAYAFTGSHRITLPRWTRGPWMVLHELAHLLVNNHGHGPRFVGALMGLVCRHLEYDATDLMQLADECGVKYDVRSIGSVPTHGLQWRAERALAVEGPMTAIDLACWLSIGTRHEAVSWRQVHGALLRPIAAGRVRLLRGKYTPVAAHAALAE